MIAGHRTSIREAHEGAVVAGAGIYGALLLERRETAGVCHVRAGPAHANEAGRAEPPASRTLEETMRGILIVIIAAVAHSFASMVCGVGEVMTSGFFDHVLSPSDPAFRNMKHILEFPLMTIVHKMDVPIDIFVLPLMIANSFLWGVAVYLCVAFVGKCMLGGPGSRR
jgi:hypothetical protein